MEYEEAFIDGGKIGGMANCYTFVWRKSVAKQLAKVKAGAKEMFHRYGGKGNLTKGKKWYTGQAEEKHSGSGNTKRSTNC